MIVWGGWDMSARFFYDGGRYNPAGNSWTAVTTNNAPAGRAFHTAVWTGSEMIVWGGGENGRTSCRDRVEERVDLANNKRTAVSTNAAPSRRAKTTAGRTTGK